MTKLLTLISFFTISLYAIDSTKIIKKVEDNLNGKTAFMKISMIVKTKRIKRKIQMNIWSEGNEKSFIQITYPKKDKGITFLKIDNQMWQYVPRIERVIKIPSSMMLQSWMGSDFSNDDLVKESSIAKDYTHILSNESNSTYEILLKPKEDATVVWGKVVMIVSKKYLLPIKVDYFDEDGTLIRELLYKKVKKIQDRFYPTYWEMNPKTKEKEKHQTIVEINKAEFDKNIDKSYFNKSALKRYSR